MTEAVAVDAVERRSNLAHGEFVSRYLAPLEPVIVTDAIDHWPARARWSIEFFRERYGTRTVTIDGTSYTFADFLDRVERSDPGRPSPYFRNVLIESWAPELMADISPMPYHLRPNWLDSRLFPERPSLTSIELYIGGAGAKFPVLHYDGMHTHAYLMQVVGSKEYLFYPPDQGEYLYPRAGAEANKSSVDDLERPDLSRFPKFARAVASRCILRAGEMLFVPSGWWHTARILEPTITISANTVNASNWKPFVADYVAAAARHRTRNRLLAMSAYLRVFGLIAPLVSMW